MLPKKNRHINDDAEMQITPMIDIVFQLLIFFLLSAKFISLEGQLSSYLPKDRGLDATNAITDLVNVTFFLQWRDDGPQGRVRCLTIGYRSPADGSVQNQKEFSSVPYDAASGGIPYGPGGNLIDFGYTVPDFGEIERYVRFRKDTYTEVGGSGKELPVIVNFEDKVPTQVVVTLLDICKRVGIQDFTIAAKEHAYD